MTLLYMALVLTTGAFWMLASRESQARQARDVLRDLDDGEDGDASRSQVSGALQQNLELGFQCDLGEAGLFSVEERTAFYRTQRLRPVGGMVAGLLLSGLVFHEDVSALLAFSVLGLALGYLWSRSRLRQAKARFIGQIIQHLPLEMERIVMAVEAGLDILPGLEAVLAVEEQENAQESSRNPVSRLLRRVCQLSNAGLPFECSLREVAMSVECPALRHAFIHLAVAYREGGEVIAPLRELSDSTQLYYQESLEEEVAKLPVKATLPLLCTFAGLVVCFITAPLIQVMSVIMTAVPD